MLDSIFYRLFWEFISFLIILVFSSTYYFLNNLFDSNSWWGNFSANIFSDILVACLIGIYLSRYFDNKEKRKEQKEKLRVAVSMLWGEIKHNKKQLKVMICELPKANLPYPALEISAWETIDNRLIIDGLKVEDVANLLKIYNRTKTINMMYYTMLDKVNWIEDLQKKPIIKAEFINKLVDRCVELLDFINEVIPEDVVNQGRISS
jgi:hypothetical protein